MSWATHQEVFFAPFSAYFKLATCFEADKQMIKRGYTVRPSTGLVDWKRVPKNLATECSGALKSPSL